MKPINLRIAEELGVREQQVAAAISLLDGGATVPFVARYRKEATAPSLSVPQALGTHSTEPPYPVKAGRAEDDVAPSETPPSHLSCARSDHGQLIRQLRRDIRQRVRYPPAW